MNEKVHYNDEIEIVGIDHTTSVSRLEDEINKVELSKEKYSILLYHEPKGIEIGVKKGFDLMLYGHTHGGQIFPITKIVDMMYKYGNGFYEVGETIINTTSGAGLWGPKMRLGSQNEIVVFNLSKK